LVVVNDTANPCVLKYPWSKSRSTAYITVWSKHRDLGRYRVFITFRLCADRTLLGPRTNAAPRRRIRPSTTPIHSTGLLPHVVYQFSLCCRLCPLIAAKSKRIWCHKRFMNLRMGVKLTYNPRAYF